MFRLTKKQVDAFSAACRDRFIERLASHVESGAQAKPGAPGRSGGIEEVRSLVALAERLELDTELDIASFVELFTFFGLAVDDARVKEILDAEDISISDKMTHLEYLAAQRS